MRSTGQPTNQTKAEAIEELKTYQAKATPENFQALCEERSDCGSFAQGGDLGTFERGAMQKPFEDAAFALEVCLSGAAFMIMGTLLPAKTS